MFIFIKRFYYPDTYLSNGVHQPSGTLLTGLAALAAILMWSVMALLTVKLPAVPPFFLAGSTLLLGGLISLPKIRAWHWNTKFILVGAAAVFLYQFLLFIALRSSPAIECNLINYLWPLLIILLAPIFDRQVHLRPVHILGGLLGFSGAVIAIYNQANGISTALYWGYLMALGAALTWSSYSLYMKRFANTSAWTMGPVCIISGIFSLSGSMISGEVIRLGRVDILYLVIIGLGPLGLSFYLWNYAMKRADPRKIGTLSYLAPILSTIWLSLGTGLPLSFGLLIALGLVVSGAILGRRERRN
ncbi:MAG: EamA family transporter [Planctomycetes bacterium]|nr:EamA family transporter [Planctomycetota bacterium]